MIDCSEGDEGQRGQLVDCVIPLSPRTRSRWLTVLKVMKDRDQGGQVVDCVISQSPRTRSRWLTALDVSVTKVMKDREGRWLTVRNASVT